MGVRSAVNDFDTHSNFAKVNAISLNNKLWTENHNNNFQVESPSHVINLNGEQIAWHSREKLHIMSVSRVTICDI